MCANIRFTIISLVNLEINRCSIEAEITIIHNTIKILTDL